MGLEEPANAATLGNTLAVIVDEVRADLAKELVAGMLAQDATAVQVALDTAIAAAALRGFTLCLESHTEPAEAAETRRRASLN